MINKDLVSYNKLQQDIKSMKIFGIFMGRKKRNQLKNMEKNLQHILEEVELFNKRFISNGWCVYDRMDLKLIEEVNKTFEESGIEAAERILVNYYKTDIKKFVYQIKHSDKSFSIRDKQIEQFFEEHFEGKYHTSIPLGLIIIDGAVNDFTRSKGFFSDGTSVDAWDCLVGCSEGLNNLKKIFNEKRTKTNTKVITLPYRNGILHGRDLNYANEYVSCKCVALMFAIADWMRMKSSEESRKKKYEKSLNPPPLKESLTRLKESKRIRKEIEGWQRKTITIGKDVPTNGMIEEYAEYPYVEIAIEMLNAWKNKNYGKLSSYLSRMFPNCHSDGQRAGECRTLFENKALNTFELIEVEERGCCLSKIAIKVQFSVGSNEREEILIFGCSYEGENGILAVPWRNNGNWILIPWDVRGIYK